MSQMTEFQHVRSCLALPKVDPDLMPGIPYVPLSPPGVSLEYRATSSPRVLTAVAPQNKTKH